MSLWLIRARSEGEYERKFLDEEPVYLTWGVFVALLLERAVCSSFRTSTTS